jgi:hypothetical protein
LSITNPDSDIGLAVTIKVRYRHPTRQVDGLEGLRVSEANGRC